MPIVISDTSPLFYLAKIQRLELLWKLHETVTVPDTVWNEALACGPDHPEVAASLRRARAEGWLAVVADDTLTLDEDLANLDAGEACAIALATQLHAELVIIDESEGRRIAENRGFIITGTAGLLLKARNKGLIPSLGIELNRLANLGFRISRNLMQEMIRDAGE